MEEQALAFISSLMSARDTVATALASAANLKNHMDVLSRRLASIFLKVITCLCTLIATSASLKLRLKLPRQHGIDVPPGVCRLQGTAMGLLSLAASERPQAEAAASHVVEVRT